MGRGVLRPDWLLSGNVFGASCTGLAALKTTAGSHSVARVVCGSVRVPVLGEVAPKPDQSLKMNGDKLENKRFAKNKETFFRLRTEDAATIIYLQVFTANTLYQKFEKNIPRNETARTRSQFLHSCIYIRLWEHINRSHTAKKKCGKFETNIPRKEISGPQSQFPHSCVCERIIYSHDGSAFPAGGNMWTDPGNI